MKKAIKPLTIISMILIAVGIISAAIAIIFQKSLSVIYTPAPLDVFAFPETYVCFVLVRAVIAVISLFLIRKSAGKIGNILGVILTVQLLIIPSFIESDIPKSVAKGDEYISALACVIKSLTVSEAFLWLGFIVLMILAVMSLAANKNEKEKGALK